MSVADNRHEVLAKLAGAEAATRMRGIPSVCSAHPLGIEAALLWGALMGAASLLPAVGTGLVWVPMALYLLFTGQIWQGLVLVLCDIGEHDGPSRFRRTRHDHGEGEPHAGAAQNDASPRS